MSEYLDTLERGFVDASRRLAARKRRIRRRRGACAAAIVVLIGAPALAATGMWRPKLGNDRIEGATITGQSPPEAQLELLGVLRREQNSRDRGVRTREALTMVGQGVAGVRTNSIRLLAQTSQDRGIVLIPVARFHLNGPKWPADTPASVRARFAPARDGLCVWALDSDHGKPGGAGAACYSTQDVEQGRAWGSLGHRAAWLVPDGVATLKTEYDQGRTVTAAVHDNLALYTEPRERHRWVRTTWLDAGGRVVKTIPGTPAPPTGPHADQFPAEYDPPPPGARHSGAVLRVGTRKYEGLTHIELLIKPPVGPLRLGGHKTSDALTILLTRPACGGARRVMQRQGYMTISHTRPNVQFDITPSTGDFDRATWCPGHYRGAIRQKTGRKIVGTFAFDVR
jgi:hypothetical protein